MPASGGFVKQAAQNKQRKTGVEDGKTREEAKRDRTELLVDIALGAIVTILALLAVLFACSLFGGI